jgi:hypothetical protein
MECDVLTSFENDCVLIIHTVILYLKPVNFLKYRFILLLISLDKMYIKYLFACAKNRSFYYERVSALSVGSICFLSLST